MHYLTSLAHKSRIAIASGASFLLAAPVLAQDNPIMKNLQDTQTGIQGGTAAGVPRPLPETIGYLIRAALGLLGVIMVVLIIYAGFLYLTAAGDDDKIEKAKHTIKNAVIGAVLIFTAYAITTFVVDSIVKATT